MNPAPFTEMNKDKTKNFIGLSPKQLNKRCGVNYQHKELAEGRWFELNFLEQMANIGSEVERAILWKNKKNESRSKLHQDEYSIKALDRALELLDLTIAGIRNRKHLKELTRLREALVDYFYFDNQFSSSDKLWRTYFYAFSYAARLNK